MISKVLKVIGKVLVGVGAFKFGQIFCKVIYSKGFQSGELTTLSVLSELEGMCKGISSEYVESFNNWKNGETKFRYRVCDANSIKPFENFDGIMKTVSKHDLEVAKAIVVKDSPFMLTCHQGLLRSYFNKDDVESDVLELYKLDEVDLDIGILSTLASKYNIAFYPRSSTFIFMGKEDNIIAFMNDLWTNYALMSIDYNKPGIPVGYYTPDTISNEDE